MTTPETPSIFTRFPARVGPSNSVMSHREVILAMAESLELLLRQTEEPGKAELPHFPQNVPENLGNYARAENEFEASEVEAFMSFDRKIDDLDEHLKKLAENFRKLGNPAKILESAYQVRERLAHIQYLFRENASHLFPRRISPPKHSLFHVVGPEKRKLKAITHATRPEVLNPLSLNMFPSELNFLADSLSKFLTCLTEFPEFTDEATTSIRSLETDLRYSASCLAVYSFDRPVHQYLHEFSNIMSDHFDNVSSALFVFTEVDLATVWQSAKNQEETKLLQLSSTATFFSAVTATTLQFSYDSNKVAVENVVNLLWFSSMVLSIAAAANSFMAVILKNDISRPDRYNMPRWILFCIKNSPALFLVVSGALFISGFCCFAFASNQVLATSISTVILAFSTTSGLVCVFSWLLLTSHIEKSIAKHIYLPFKILHFTMIYVISHFIRGFVYSYIILSSCLPKSPPSLKQPSVPNDQRNNLSFSTGELPLLSVKVPKSEGSVSPAPLYVLLPKLTAMKESHNLTVGLKPMVCLQFSPDGKMLAAASKQVATYNLEDPSYSTWSPTYWERLRLFEVDDIAWSPISNFLVISWPIVIEMLMHMNGALSLKQSITYRSAADCTSWFPDGNSFISVQESWKNILWKNLQLGGLRTISVVLKYDIKGKVLARYKFDYFHLYIARVTADATRLVCLGVPEISPTGLQPDKLEPRWHIIIYNMHSYQVENQVPISKKPKDLALARGSEKCELALISFKKEPPQLWQLEYTASANSRFTHRRTYLPPSKDRSQSKVEFIGRNGSCFGGTNYEIVISIGRAGDILIWHRDSGELLHNIQTKQSLTCVAWNRSRDDSFMFATGGQKGSISIWAEQLDEEHGVVGSSDLKATSTTKFF